MTLSQQPTSDATVRPRAAWYTVVVVVWVASAVVFGTVVASFVGVVNHGVTAVQASHTVPVSNDGITIYSKSKPASNDCLLQDSSGQSIDMDGLTFDLDATFDGTTVYAVATSPGGLSAGEYRVSCRDAGGQLYYGDKLPLGSILVRIGVSMLLGLIGLVALIVLLVKRHTSKSRIRNQALAYAQGGGPGWAPGWASQPGPPLPYQPPPGYGPPQPYPQQNPPYGGQEPPPRYDAPPESPTDEDSPRR